MKNNRLSLWTGVTILASAVLASCAPPSDETAAAVLAGSDPIFTSFAILANDNPGLLRSDAYGFIEEQDDRISLYVPCLLPLNDVLLVARFSTTATVVRAAGTEVQSGVTPLHYYFPQQLSVEATDGTARTYRVQAVQPRLDAFVANFSQDDGIWLNDGRAGLTDLGSSLGASVAWNVALGDLDTDGDLDAFICIQGADLIWLNDGRGVFADTGQALGTSYSRAVALGDLDADGDLDAFVASLGVPSRANRVWLNDGRAGFADSGQTLGTGDSNGVALGDLDADGDLDAVVANWGADRVWLNDGRAGFTDSGQTLGTSDSIDVALGDLDADGDLDAFVASNVQSDRVWLNDGAGVFTDSGQILGSSYRLALGDLDADGDLDAVVTRFSQPDQVWLNDGAGVFTDSGQSLNAGASEDVALGDLDADGDLDVLITRYGSPNQVWLNDGAGVFTDSGQALGTRVSHAVALGDLDGR